MMKFGIRHVENIVIAATGSKVIQAIWVVLQNK